MRDFETIRRSVIRRAIKNNRTSSWPLLSGDTYRSVCNYRIDSVDDIENFLHTDRPQGKLFVAAGFAQDFHVRVASKHLKNFQDCELIIHNGDLIPEAEIFNEWSNQFSRIYSVNWLGDNSKVFPLPIGLENFSYLRNGVPRDYKRENSKERPIRFLVAFNDHTNPSERTSARTKTGILTGAYVMPTESTPRQYRQLVSKSKYVISPPGNGPDCHRTWEALYLGATPIVKKAFWPFNDLPLPVVVVEDWSDIERSVAAFETQPSDFPSDWEVLIKGEFFDQK